jgi:hypothetical protein
LAIFGLATPVLVLGVAGGGHLLVRALLSDGADSAPLSRNQI